MSEEVVKQKKLRCDVCGLKEIIEVPGGFLSRPKTPASWGYDKDKRDQMCPVCLKSYVMWYDKGYKAWKDSRKGKEGQ